MQFQREISTFVRAMSRKVTTYAAGQLWRLLRCVDDPGQKSCSKISPFYNKLSLQLPRVIAIAILLSIAVMPLASTRAVTNAFTITATTTFTPLHTYFMAASGCSDANAGTSAGSPWCTPNHPVVCGDVIVAAAGNYNGDLGTWGTVSGCPSTTGGIDGTGGIYEAVLLCGGAGLGTSNGCFIDCAVAACNGQPGAGPRAGININGNNWAAEGFTITCNTVHFCEATPVRSHDRRSRTRASAAPAGQAQLA